MSSKHDSLSRRQFLVESTAGLSVLAAAGASRAFAGPGAAPNPFALDTEGLRKTDPALVSHTESTRFASLFPEPRRISVSGDRVHVAAGNAVHVLSLGGDLRRKIQFAESVRCAVGAPEGGVYIGLKNRVELRNSEGGTVTQWEVSGKKTWISGMAVGANDVYVADSGNRVVLRFDRKGGLVGRIGEKNQERNIPGIILPSPYLQAALGPDGLLRVNNPGRHRVELYTPDGDLELSWGVAGGGISGFCGCCNPIGLCVLPDGRCLTCEKGVPRVKLYGADGKFVSVVAGAELFPDNARAGASRRSDGLLGGLDAAAAADGKVYVLDLVSGEVRVMVPKAAVQKA